MIHVSSFHGVDVMSNNMLVKMGSLACLFRLRDDGT